MCRRRFIYPCLLTYIHTYIHTYFDDSGSDSYFLLQDLLCNENLVLKPRAEGTEVLHINLLLSHWNLEVEVCMYVFVCMCVSMYVCVYVCMYVWYGIYTYGYT